MAIERHELLNGHAAATEGTVLNVSPDDVSLFVGFNDERIAVDIGFSQSSDRGVDGVIERTDAVGVVNDQTIGQNIVVRTGQLEDPRLRRSRAVPGRCVWCAG